jgi:regulator of cell morphogenesis and NO signaling
VQQDMTTAGLDDLKTRTLGEIAAALPGATAVFRAAGLDYCCGGQETLRDAAAANALDLDQLILELRSLDHERLPSSADLDTKTLTDTIVTRFHRVHSKEIPELIQLAERVEVVHKDHPAVPTGLAALLRGMLGELTVHMQKEEIILFPQLCKGAMMPLVFPITTMMAEHQEHGAHLEDMKRLTNDLTVPEDGCPTWRALYAGLAKFGDDLIEHIHIENNILFPRFLTNEA